MENTSAPIHIHQIYYSDETRAMLDPGFTPHNNVGQRPDWAEYWPIRNLLLNQNLDENAWYGVLSPRFKQKTGLGSEQVFEFIKAAPADCDVVTFPLFFDEAALYENIFIQGADNHPNAWPVFKQTARRLTPDVNLETLVMDSTQIQFCNYFVAKPRFWRHWFSKTEEVFAAAEQSDTAWGQALNTLTRHRGVAGYQLKVFVMERLLSLILATEPQWRVHAWPAQELPAGRFPVKDYPEWAALDTLKQTLRRTGQEDLRKAYNALRETVYRRLLAEGKLENGASTTMEAQLQELFHRQTELPASVPQEIVAQEQLEVLQPPPQARLDMTALIDQSANTTAADADLTRRSLQNQIRPFDHVLHVQDADWASRLRGQPAGWTLLLAAGDVLTRDALVLIERRLLEAENPEALRVLYFDHDERTPEGAYLNPHLKPAFNHDLLLSYPYMGRALVVRNDWAAPLLEAAVGEAALLRGYRLALTALREQGAAGFARLPAVLAHLTRNEPHTFANTSQTWLALAQMLAAHLSQTAPGAQVLEGPGPGTFHVIYPLPRTPKVSIIIPTKDQLHFLSRCIESLLGKTNYPDFEILIVDNDSQTAEAKAFLAGLEMVDPERIRVLRAPGPFNFSRMNNEAVKQARGEFILLLNNDTAVMQADWLSHMMRHALRQDADQEVGIVGARLLYPEGKVQHAGVIMGLRGPADHPCLGLPADAPGYMFRAQVAQNFSAVTAACLLVSKAIYEEVGGLNEDEFKVSYNDVDFCLRVGQTGRRIVFTPLATLIHEGSASQKATIEDISSAAKTERFGREKMAMYERWPRIIASDPAYNPNLSLAAHGYEYETNAVLCYDKLAGLYEHRVLAFAADHEGCGHYRIIQPLQAMLKNNLCTGGLSPEHLQPNMALRSGADTLVFQRPINDRALAALDALLQLKNVRKIFEVDDILTHIPIKSAHHGRMPKDLASRMTRSIGLCDRLVVSTEPLAHEMRNKCGDIRVVKNRIPPAFWGAKPPERGLTPHQQDRKNKPRVGWAGGVGHLGDLEMIGAVIRDLADQVDWVFFGMCPPAFRDYVKEVHPGIRTVEYPVKLMELSKSLDLAIAPLEYNLFNECKSNLKLLEYGWSGLPVVCSDIAPYNSQGSENLPATRVKNRYKDWRDAILELANDPEASRRAGLALQEKIANEWMLTGDNLQEWYQAWTD